MMATWGESEIVNFKVAYDGSAVTNNEMDAKILADSLLGISAAIEESNKIINGETSEVFIKVKSDFKRGSFEVYLAQLLTSQGVTAAANLITILGFGGVGTYGLIQLIKVGKGGKIIKKQKVDGDHSDVYFDNCDNPIFVNHLDNRVIKCYESQTVMDAVKKATTPLGFEGYDTIGFSSDDNSPELFGKDEFNILEPSEDTGVEEETLDVTITEGIFGITQTNLDGNDKGWRLSRNEGDSFPVTILDKRFLNDINNGKYSFTHGTAVRVKYKDTTKKKIKVSHDYEILEVISLYSPDSKIPKIIRKERKLIVD